MGIASHTQVDSGDLLNAPTARLGSAHPGVVTPPPASEPLLPTAAGGDYELLDLLGRGGMGVVYLARQRALKRNVAYKVLTGLDGLTAEAVARFRSEAETLARLQHPNIVQVFDSGTENGVPFLAMEYVAGGSLADRLRAGRLPPRDAAAMIGTLAAAVGHAHTHGIVHRDLKPANILLTDDGRPKVADFGLARDAARGHLTRTGMVAGTPMYMAPEHLTGKRELTPAVDVWALGVMLYEMLTGTVPFAGGDPQQILVSVLRHEAVSLRAWRPDLPRDLETVCLKCLQKEPHRRYADGKELADDLTRFLTDRPIRARPVGAVGKCARWCRRNPAAAGLAAAVMVTMIAGSAVSLEFADRAGRDREKAVVAAAAEADLRRQAERAAGAEKKAREEAEAMTAMLDSLVASIKSGTNMVAELRKQLDATAAALSTYTGDPLVRARLLYTLGITRRNIGDYNEAVPLMERSLALRTEHLGADHPLTRKTALQMGYTYYHVRRFDDAIRVAESLARAEPAEWSPDSPDPLEVLMGLKFAYGGAGRVEDAEAVAERMLSVAAKHYGDDHERTEWVRVNLPRYSLAARRFGEAIPVLEKAYARFLGHLSPTSQEAVWTRRCLGQMYAENGQPERALPLLKDDYDHNHTTCGPSHPLTLHSCGTLAQTYEVCGQFAKALPLRRALQKHYESAGDAEAAAFHARRAAQDMAAAVTW